MKKIIIILIIILFTIVAGVYYYEPIKNKYFVEMMPENNYPELTAEVLEVIGGQEVADKLIVNFEKSKIDLETAKSKYKENGSLEEEIPDITLFIIFARDAKYIRKNELAIQTLEGVFDYYKQSDIALINLAGVYQDMGEYQKAIDTYLRFYDIFGVQIQQFHLGIMRNYIALDDRDNVIKYYEEFKQAGYSSEVIEQYIAKS